MLTSTGRCTPFTQENKGKPEQPAWDENLGTVGTAPAKGVTEGPAQ